MERLSQQERPSPRVTKLDKLTATGAKEGVHTPEMRLFRLYGRP